MRISAIQMTSGAIIEDNLQQAAVLIRRAAAEGTSFIVTPEVTDQVITGRAEKIDQHFAQDDHPGVAFFSDLAAELGITLLIGSMCVRVGVDKLANRAFLFASDGALLATYDKIHLFDVDLESGENYKESDTFVPGERAVLADMDGVKLGLTICYDMRFPHLFRDLGKAGAQIIAVPAAFTVPTGQAHWHSLLRARAIETGAFIIAPAQVGDHQGARVTYGHSIIVSPWGEVLAEATEDAPGMISAEIDLSAVTKARQSVPSLQHDREYLELLAK